ncbi:MAG: DUF1512 family protein [Candidatus Hodarchaeota archaeon]
MLQIPGSEFNWIVNLIFIVMFMFIYLYGQRLQTYIWTKQVESGLRQIEVLAKQGKQIAHRALKDLKVKEEDVKSTLDDFLEFFLIEPVNVDPAGVLQRIKHLLDVRENRYEAHVNRIAPSATPVQAANAQNVLSGAMALHYVYRVVRHFLLLGKKTKSIYYVIQLQMQLPEIIQLAKAYFEAVRAFSEGKPIGDGMGPLAIAHFAREIQAGDPEEIAKHTIAFSGNFEGRTLWFVRAKGHGGHVGEPGIGIRKIVERNKGQIARIITVDAGLKLEGEDTGHVIIGVGAAIGDPGPEKFEMEDSGVKHNIPLDAIVIKESIEDALSPMKKALVDAVPKVIEKLKDGILKNSEKGDTLIVAGIGNTIGIA